MSQLRSAPAGPKTITKSLTKYLETSAPHLKHSLKTVRMNGGFIKSKAIFDAKRWKKLPNGALFLEGCALMFDGVVKIKLVGEWEFLYQPAFRFGDLSPRAQLVTSEFTFLLLDAAYTATRIYDSPHRCVVAEINYL